jgi:hypothetical protein
MRRFFGVVAVALLVAAPVAATPSSGLRGKVVRQVGGACAEPTDCTTPGSYLVLAFVRRGSAVTRRTTTHGDGTYRISLVPGVYTVRIVGAGPRTTIQPSVVTVRRRIFRSVNFLVKGEPIP